MVVWCGAVFSQRKEGERERALCWGVGGGSVASSRHRGKRVVSTLIRADFKLFLKWKRLSKVTLNVYSYFREG